MKNIIFLLTMSIGFFSCKKENVNPQTIIQTDTIHTTVIQHDTAYCTPVSDIIQGTWYCYKTNNTISTTINTPSQQVNFTMTLFTWSAFGSNLPISFSNDLKTIYDNQSNFYFSVSVYNCNEIKLIDYNHFVYYLRRNP